MNTYPLSRPLRRRGTVRLVLCKLALICAVVLGTASSLELSAQNAGAPGGGDPLAPPPEVTIPTIGPATVVQARHPNVKPGGGSSSEIGIGELLEVDVRSPELWLATLADRGIIKPDERDIKDTVLLAERERRRQAIGNLPESQRPAAQEALTSWWKAEQNKRWLTAVENYLSRLCLFIDNEAFTDLKPHWMYAWGDDYPANDSVNFSRTYTLRFRLTKTLENREKWMNLLRGQGLMDRPAVVTVGFVDEWDKRIDVMQTEVAPLAPKIWQRFSLETAPDKEVIAAIIVTILLTMLGLWLAISSNLLRDTSAPLSPSGRHPYSLGLCQLALWLFLIGTSFLFLWVVTGDRNLSVSELMLLGISATTGLGSVLVNRFLPPCRPSLLNAEEFSDNEPKSLKTRIGIEEERRNAAAAALADARAATAAHDAPATVPLEAALDATERRLTELQDRLRYFQTGGRIQQFFLDLFRERDSVSLHRFQMLAWTVCLGLVFVFGVVMRLEMPQFDNTLLLLMGISSGTYLGFKWPAANS